MQPENVTSVADEDTLPAPPIEQSRAVITAERNLPVLDGEHRQVETITAATPTITLQQAGNVANSLISGAIILIVAASIVTAIVWFIGDLHSVATTPVPAGVNPNTFTHNEIINAALNLLANLALVLVLLEVLSSIVNFVQTRHATARPLVLVPLYIVMRAILLLVAQLIVNPPDANHTAQLIVILAEMGAFSLVGLSLSIALAALREPTAKPETKKRA